MNLLESLIDILAPLECLNCRAEGGLLCTKCLINLPTVSSRCYNCRKPTADWQVCTECRGSSSLDSLYIASVYSGFAKDILWQLKLAGVRSSATLIASKIVPLITQGKQTLLAPVPTATSRARQRGYDQADLIARELSRLTATPYRKLLARSGQMHQHGLPRDRRLEQMSSAYRVTKPSKVKNANILLIDDVITTGATLESAARVLIEAGASSVSAAVFAQPPIRKAIDT